MLQPSTFKFLKDLSKNNNKPWFEKNKPAYEAAKADFEQFVTSLLEKLSKTEPAFKELKAKDCIFRIYRDVRFSKDKSPYKTNFGAAFSKGGKKHMAAGYYIHVEPGKAFMGGGMWMPEPGMLKKIRQEVDYNFKDFQKIVNSASFKKTFGTLSDEDKLKKVPQGYTDDNPAVEYLKLKSFVAGHDTDDKALMDKSAVTKVAGVFSTLKPLIDFLNAAAE